jgi:hypothetical protein
MAWPVWPRSLGSVDREPETRDEQIEEAADELGKEDRLLPLEDEALRSNHLDDAQHWRTVYEELFGFKQALLATLKEQRDKVNEAGMREIENDEIILTREADRLARRLQFWRREVDNPKRR